MAAPLAGAAGALPARAEPACAVQCTGRRAGRRRYFLIFWK
jgi:hypothetical protein